MIYFRCCSVLYPAFLLLAAASPQAHAQSTSATTPATQDAAQTRPLFRANANLVIVDVVVHDKGNPVHDLRASDFHIFEDGREQKVTVFEEHRSTDALQVAAAPPDLPANTWSNAPRYAVSSAANVLLLDALNTPLSDQVYVRQRMIRYLHTIPPGTRIAVFTLGSQLRIIEGFTTDSSAIEKALSGRGNPEKSPVMDPNFDQTLEETATLPGQGGAASLTADAMKQFAQETKSFESLLRVDMTLDSLNQLAKYLAVIPGRKNLVWFTGSMPFSLVSGQSPNLDQMADVSDQSKNTLSLMALARVSLYPVDSRGLMHQPTSDASTVAMNPKMFNSVQAQGVGGGGIARNNTAVGLQQRDQAFLDQTAFDHLNMEAFAKATGGKAFINTNALGEALPDAIADGSDYYTLAYAPTNPNYNGAFHKIEVKTPEYHYALAYRHGYFALDPAKQDKLFNGRRNPLVDAMQHGVLPLSAVPFQVRVVPSTDPAVAGEKLASGPAGGMAQQLKPPTLRYVADFVVDPTGVDSRPLPDGRVHREIELTQVAYDVEGIRENFADFGLAVDLPPATTNAGIQLHQEIDLPAGRSYLKIGVRDMLSGRIGTIEIPLTVTKQ